MTCTLGPGALNDPNTAALIRAWRKRQGRFLTVWAEAAIKRAVDRITDGETTLAMELARLERRFL